MPRFVILEHDHPQLHWDFMLESGDSLRTWQLQAIPQLGCLIPAQPSFDHRLVYLDYEGAISGSRGRVMQWDSGSFTWVVSEEPNITIALFGRRISGVAFLSAEGWTFSS